MFVHSIHSIDVFHIKGVKVGRIKSITIQLTGNVNDGWKLGKVCYDRSNYDSVMICNICVTSEVKKYIGYSILVL